MAIQTGGDGRYLLNGVPVGDQVLRVTKSGYASATVTDVRVLPGQTTTVNGNLRPEFYEMEEFEVTAEEFNEQTAQILFERQESAGMVDAIGSEQFSRAGAGDAAEIMTKVTGVSIADGKYAVIRGLSDRYTTTMLNGAEVPSADPYRKAVQLDLFPSDVIDQVSVSKTFTPDLPAGFTGGAINIITKSFPDKFEFSMEFGLGYNSHTSLSDGFLADPKNPLNSLAMGASALDLKGAAAAGSPPTLPQNSPRSETTASAAARREQANAVQAYNQALGTTAFAPESQHAPLNTDASLSIGDTTTLFGRRLGYFAALNHEHKFSGYSDGVVNTYGPALTVRSQSKEDVGVEEINWGAIVTLGYEVSENHEVSFTFLNTQSGESYARRRIGDNNAVTGNDPATVLDQSALVYTERHLHMFQLRGRHEFPGWNGFHADWLASLANTTQKEPDTRLFNYFRTPDGNGGWAFTFDNNLPQPIRPTRYFRELNEDNGTLKADFTLPFDIWSEREAKFKFGAFIADSDRTFTETTYSYRSQTGDSGFTDPLDPNTYLGDPSQLDYTATPVSGVRTNYSFQRYVTSDIGNSRYDGHQTLSGGYLMSELPLLERLKLVGGGRYEITSITIGSQSGGSVIDQTDLLPAVGLVWEVATNMNVRLNFGQTVARPTYREFAPYSAYDTVTDEVIRGNTNLVMSAINNYDLRWEWFPNPGEVLSASVFYKQITDAIEKYSETLDGSIVTYQNRQSEATLYGIELELRKSLRFISDGLDPFSFGMNFAYIESSVPLTETELFNKRSIDPSTPEDRPLYDQSPYILNVDLGFDRADLGTKATLLFNITGPRVSLVRGVGPDIYDHPGVSLDFVVSQRLSKNWKVKFSAKNLLDPDFTRTYGLDKTNPQTGDPYYRSSYSKGRTFKVSLEYKF